MRLVEDRDLLDRFRSGEKRAMAEVFESYSDGLARFLRTGFGFNSGSQRVFFKGIDSRHDLHDLVAETFRAAFEERARMSYSGLSPYAAYLKAVARNLVIDRLRAKSSSWVPLEGEAAEEAERNQEQQASLEDDYQRREVVTLVQGFLAALDDDERRFVELRYQSGLPQRDVAAKLDKSRRYVRTLEVAVRKKMIRHMKGKGYLENGI